MINRVTDNIKYNMLTNSMFNIQGQYGQLMEKLSTQKSVNRPSDDPIGTNSILDFRTALVSIEQYQSNITDATSWLKLTETNIGGLRNIISQAQSMAVSESGANGSPETRAASLDTLESLISEALSMLNAQSGDNYIFGGSVTDAKPFSINRASAAATVNAASTNVFDGTVTATYSGTENKSYALRIVSGGPLASATYRISTDGGKTWGALQTDLSAPVTVDGLTMNFSAGTNNLASNDQFVIKATAAGYYSGNNDVLDTIIGKNNSMPFNVTGAEAFTGQFALASVLTGATGITADSSIGLTKNASGTWSLDPNTQYPNLTITSQSSDNVTIDVDNDGTDDIVVDLTGTWDTGNTIELSIKAGMTPGGIPTKFEGSGSIDLMSALNALKSALVGSDQDRAMELIGAQLDNLQKVDTQLLKYETKAGARMQSMEITSKNHKSMDLQITNMLGDIENADLTKLIPEFQMKQIALEASYKMAAQIGQMSIMDYI
jgi:flagellar hook-associated protein 3 FlgL